MHFSATRAFLSLTLALVTAFVATPLTHDRTTALNDCLAGNQYIAHELLVGFKPGQSVLQLNDPERAAAIVSSFSQAGATTISSPLVLPSGDVFLVKFGGSSDLCTLMTSLPRSIPEIAYVEPNFVGIVVP